jgi:ABC-type bacteriocin/lantibiotic exporter with double-glycine peptidase domain
MEKTSPLKRLWNLLVLEKKEIISIYFFAILSGLIQLSVPLGIQAIIGFVLGAAMVTSIYILILVVVIGVLITGILQINQMRIIEKIQQKIFTEYAFEFAESMPKFDLKKIDDFYLPEKVNRFFDTINLQKGISKLLIDVPIASIQILFGLLLLTFYHPFFIAFGLLLILILWLILRFTSQRGLNTSLSESKFKYKVVAWFEEIARVIKTFKFSQGTHLNLRKTDKNVLNYLNARTSHFRVLLFQFRSLLAFKVAITAAMLIVGTYLLLNQQLNIGEFIAAEIVILTVISAVEKLINSLDSVYDTVTALEKLATFTEIPAEKDGTMYFDKKKEGVEIKFIDFNFSFGPNLNTLQNLNITIPSGATVCISGNDGSGKSTLLEVMSGSYREFGGAILLNNVPIVNYQLEALRHKIGLFLNDHDIFEGTIYENITMGHSEVTPEHIVHMAENLGISEFLNNIPFGYDTKIDSNGKKLPSSMVKKILLLRAFANQPSLLLLEEPWQGFDEKVKTKMMEYFLSKQNNATIIIVSNDQSFARKCDIDIYLTKGVAQIIKNRNEQI